MLGLDILIEDRLFYTCVGDGLVLSTASGCPGASLNAGGIIMHPQIDGLMITPKCNQHMARPAVIPPGYQLTIQSN